MTLPISSIVDVSISVSPSSPPKQGFGVAAVVTDEDDISGSIQSTPIFFYSSIEEVALLWPTNSETYLCAQNFFGQNPSPVKFATIAWDNTGGQLITAALDAAEDLSTDWYGVLLLADQRDTSNQITVAAWVEARTKMLALTTNDANTLVIGETLNNAYLLFNANYTRTLCIYSSTVVGEYVDAAALGKLFVTNFSSQDSVITLKFKNLSGISTENINTQQKAGLDEKRANILTDVAGTSMFTEGWMSSQLYADEIHAIDWLTAEIESNVFSYLISRVTKVPLTDKGGAAMQQQVRRALDVAVSNGMLAPGETIDGIFLPNGYEILVQKVATISPADKSNRIGPTITFTALLAGAIHTIQIRGVVER